MGEITTASSEQKAGVRRSKKLSTRVDLTPMVDLGFLLITFFIFTTKISEPKKMTLAMPKDSDIDDGTKAPRSVTLTVLPIENDKVFYYHGILAEALNNHEYGITNYNIQNGIGGIIREKQKTLDRIGKGRKSLIFIIKPSEHSVYKNTVDLLDEVLINEIKYYALMDPDDADKAAIKNNNK